jgi:hypothetical protein
MSLTPEFIRRNQEEWLAAEAGAVEVVRDPPGLWDDLPIPKMLAEERADLEREAGRAFLSDLQALEYRRRKRNSWTDPEAAKL